MLTTAQATRNVKAALRRYRMSASPAEKARDRLVRRLQAYCWHAYEGDDFNRPHMDEYLVHLRGPSGRESIRITAGGYLMRHGPVVFVAELFAEAAE